MERQESGQFTRFSFYYVKELLNLSVAQPRQFLDDFLGKIDIGRLYLCVSERGGNEPPIVFDRLRRILCCGVIHGLLIVNVRERIAIHNILKVIVPDYLIPPNSGRGENVRVVDDVIIYCLPNGQSIVLLALLNKTGADCFGLGDAQRFRGFSDAFALFAELDAPHPGWKLSRLRNSYILFLFTSPYLVRATPFTVNGLVVNFVFT